MLEMLAYMPAVMTAMSAITGTAANNAKYQGQVASAQQDVVNANYLKQQYDINATQEEASGQRARLDTLKRGAYVASAYDAGAAASGTFGPDMAVARARIMTEAAYQGESKEWSYQNAARTARMQGEAAVWGANAKLNQVASGASAVGLANMGVMTSAAGSMFDRYGPKP